MKIYKSISAGIALAALAAAVPAAAHESSKQQETSNVAKDEKVAIVMEMKDAWETRDWAKAVQLFAPDGVLHSMMVEPVKGREALAKRINYMGERLQSINWEVRNIGRVGNVVFIERVDRFVYEGHAGAVPVTGVIEIENGLITEWREYYDRAELLAEMGIKEDFDAATRK